MQFIRNEFPSQHDSFQNSVLLLRAELTDGVLRSFIREAETGHCTGLLEHAWNCCRSAGWSACGFVLNKCYEDAWVEQAIEADLIW